jgi:hypothetical protein
VAIAALSGTIIPPERRSASNKKSKYRQDSIYYLVAP